MNRMLPIGFFLAATIGFSGTTPAAAATSPAQQEIQHVVDAFQTAIVAKDGKTLGGLFLSQGGAWFTVLSDDSYARMKARFPKAPKYKQGSYTEFVEMVATSKEAMQEKFSNVRIDTDGAVASVYFDFVFLLNGAENNRGSETWHLIKTDDGWKITSMTYSANLPPKS